MLGDKSFRNMHESQFDRFQDYLKKRNELQLAEFLEAVLRDQEELDDDDEEEEDVTELQFFF